MEKNAGVIIQFGKVVYSTWGYQSDAIIKSSNHNSVANTHVPYLRKPWFGLDYVMILIIIFVQWKKRQCTPKKSALWTPKPWSKGHLGPYPLVIRHGLLETTTYIHDDFPVMDLSFD